MGLSTETPTGNVAVGYGFAVQGATLDANGHGYYIYRRLLGRSDWERCPAYKSGGEVRTHSPLLPTKFEFFVVEILNTGARNVSLVSSYDPVAESDTVPMVYKPAKSVVGQVGVLPAYTLTSNGTNYLPTPAAIPALFLGDAWSGAAGTTIGAQNVPGFSNTTTIYPGQRFWGV